MRRKLLPILLALLLVATPVAQAKSLADIAPQNSVARVVFELPKINFLTGERDLKGKSAGKMTASAWAVDEDHLITAAHVCTAVQSAAVDWRIPDRVRLEVVDEKDEIRKLTATVRLLDPVHDLCALWAPKHGLKPMEVRKDWKSLRRFEAIRVVGAPLGEYPLARDCYISSKNGADQELVEMRNRLITSCDVLPGYSGGPILDEEGAVVGVVSGGFFIWFSPSFVTFGATAPQLQGFLTRLR